MSVRYGSESRHSLSYVELILLFGKDSLFTFLWNSFSALVIVSLWASWSFGCSKCQLNQSLEQIIQENPTEEIRNNDVISYENNAKSKNKEYNVYNVYNESFKSNESNVYDQYDEYNQYEQYREKYAPFPW